VPPLRLQQQQAKTNMGQAKDRGSFDERVAQSRARKAEEERVRQERAEIVRKQAREQWDAMSEEEKDKVREEVKRRRNRPGAVVAAVAMMAAVWAGS
jgi:CHASE3 domain sensor protein